MSKYRWVRDKREQEKNRESSGEKEQQKEEEWEGRRMRKKIWRRRRRTCNALEKCARRAHLQSEKLYALHVHHTVKYILTNTKCTRTSMVTHLSFSLISSQPVMCLMCGKEDREQGKYNVNGRRTLY